MEIHGTEKWIGTIPNQPSIKQEILMDIIYEVTGDTLIGRYDSESAYDFIAKYKDNLFNQVKAIHDIDTTDKYVYYSDIFLNEEYIFTIKNYCYKKVDPKNLVSSKVKKYEIEVYESDCITYIEDDAEKLF